MPAADFYSDSFQRALATFLDNASCENLPHLADKAHKAGQDVDENRNAGSPALITEMLLSLVEGIGGPASVQPITKRVRDDVSFGGREMPWRRVPVWLVLKVAMQRQLQLLYGGAVGYAAYRIISCIILSQLLDDCVKSRMLPALVSLLQKKLGRKLAKLERQTVSGVGVRVGVGLGDGDGDEKERGDIQALIHDTAPTFGASIQQATNYMEAELRRFKSENLRKIPLLPLRATNDEERLALQSSKSNLERRLFSARPRNAWLTMDQMHLDRRVWETNLNDNPAFKNTQSFKQGIIENIKTAENARASASELWKKDLTSIGETDAVQLCEAISRTISDLIVCMAPGTQSNMAMNSALLLETFDQWVLLDTICVGVYPLLREYRPMFSPELLNVLQLPGIESTARLRRIQALLHRRGEASARTSTIFSEGQDSFGTRSASSSTVYEDIYDQIIARQDQLRDSKTRQWEKECQRYDQLGTEIGSLACKCTYVSGEWSVRGCTKCYKKRTRNRMKITIHEDLLPASRAASMALVFELHLPQCFAVYRNITWKIATGLAYPTSLVGKSPERLLKDTKLPQFGSLSKSTTITMASTSKVFMGTHYRDVRMKCGIDKVLLPLGADFKLFDTASRIWVKDLTQNLTLAHYCRISIPTCLASALPAPPSHPPAAPQGPSSYEAVASRRECPTGVSVHEFEAYQRLLSGTARRWPTILVELGSSNVDFGKEDTVVTLSQLICQAGPMLPARSATTAASAAGRGLQTPGAITTTHVEKLGLVHAFFEDGRFVDRLVDEIEKRFLSIEKNWRETYCMEALITLLLRTMELNNDRSKDARLQSLLLRLRGTTLDWTAALRKEVMAANDDKASHRASRYAFKAALLCRRTFAPFQGPHHDAMSATDLETFVRASIALQQNLTVRIESLGEASLALIKLDAVMCHDIEPKIQEAVTLYHESICEAIMDSSGIIIDRSDSSQCLPRFDAWRFLAGSSSGWMCSTMHLPHPDADQQGEMSQHVSLHVTEGHLLIDGKTIGKPPDNIRDSADVKALFGDKQFLTYPSALPGMSYRLATPFENHMIHFGIRDGEVIVVSARRSGEVFEYVPLRCFVDKDNVFDLPRGLVEDCFHWLEKRRGLLEIRRSRTRWVLQANDWSMNLHSRQVHRPGQVLVNPHGKTAALVCQIFEGFEDTQQLTIFQPTKPDGTLSVEIRHLELSFFVNRHGALQCRELGAVVDQNQDAGTLYGYQSMIVLRDALDAQRRSLIVPLGELQWKRSTVHINLRAVINKRLSSPGDESSARNRAYARFEIDNTLGRLTCPPEPRLLCTKVQLHAFTSYALADPLTGRTGEEEAFHTLLSGRMQPWFAFTGICLKVLGQVQMLAPKRSYYPEELKVLQKVAWDEHLPVGLQNDRYRRVLHDLVAKADRLRRFEEAAGTSENSHAVELYDWWARYKLSDLERRGEIQRLRYECCRQDSEPDCPIESLDESRDRRYVSRGRRSRVEAYGDAFDDSSCRASAVLQVVRILREKPESVFMCKDLSTILNKWARFGGSSGAVQKELQPISVLVDPLALQDQWGTLVETCRRSQPADMHRLMFTLAGFAFSPKANMDAICLLAAFCYLPKLRSIKVPHAGSYSDFVFNKELSAHMLRTDIDSASIEYVPGRIEAVGRDAVAALIELERAEHMAKCKQDGYQLAGNLMLQWPDSAVPDAEDFASAYINVRAAMKRIVPLWQCLYRNRCLSGYITRVQDAIEQYRVYAAPRLMPLNPNGVIHQSTPVLVLQGQKVPSLLRDLCSLPFSSSLPEWPATTELCLPHKNNVRAATTSDFIRPSEFFELEAIICTFANSSEPLRRTYGQDLAASLRALEAMSEQMSARGGQTAATPLSVQELNVIMQASETCLALTLQRIKGCLSEPALKRSNHVQFRSGYSWLQDVGLWPRLTPVSILELLRSKEKTDLEVNLFCALVRYGKRITLHQRLQRLLRALVKKDERRIQEELTNRGHENWKPHRYPDWLLLEIDSNMLIRDEQVTVAKAMIAPASAENSVFQLNMGKGKTSMIVPMVMCVLADGMQLARLGVPKALLLPTAQVLQARLGGLVGREVRQVPFSRRLLMLGNCRDTFSLFKRHHEQLTQSSGIMIAAPEHLLAFKLSSEQCYVDGRDMRLAVDMMQFQAHLRDTLCRDVLDESDFTLAVRTQLVYPSGTFTAVDGAPYRWELVQALLSLLEVHFAALAVTSPNRVNVVRRPGGGFPLVYILHPSIEDEVRQLLVQDIVDGRVPFFRLSAPIKSSAVLADLAGTAPLSLQEAQRLLELALGDTQSDDAIEHAAAMFPDADAAANGLLLMRGLLQHGILLTCLKKRWNVQYGLHPKRWPIAVPYEARGVPSERSEFGHPDVTIIFTCLAFYYAGVSLEQFRQGLNHVLHHVDDPATEYEKWSAGDGAVALADDLRHWSSINIDDEGQVERLWNSLRFARSVVNHFLNTFVFPLYCRQFSVKLQASAWDLPIFNKTCQYINDNGSSSSHLSKLTSASPPRKMARTTGFSGTNDNKAMLPLTIKQHDLPGLQQTNAEVLTYLLQPRNRGYICTGSRGSTRWSEQELVTSLARTRIQVFIDAGAYILENTNENLARTWLALTRPDIKAAVFFKESDNRAWVVFRDVTAAMAPLVSTPFAERLEECIVYYDEAHTRGVDLQLPANTRGALTLALGQTKDHTVQGMSFFFFLPPDLAILITNHTNCPAAMRLRQLGTTQSVTFYAPPEVDQNIRDLANLGKEVNRDFVNSAHVVRWLLEQTCLANKQLGSLYASNGVDFCRRTDALWKYQNTFDNAQSRKSLLSVIEQPERQSLKVMYGHAAAVKTNTPQPTMRRKSLLKPADNRFDEDCLNGFMDQLRHYHSTDTGIGTAMKGTFEEVEQEREVEVQVEQQRSTRSQIKFTAYEFPGAVCSALRTFVDMGVLSSGIGYEPCFSFIARTDIGKRHGVRGIQTRLFVSHEFTKTVVPSSFFKSLEDDFLASFFSFLYTTSSQTPSSFSISFLLTHTTLTTASC